MSVDGFNLSVKGIITHKQFHNIVEANPQCNPDRRMAKTVSIPVIAYN